MPKKKSREMKLYGGFLYAAKPSGGFAIMPVTVTSLDFRRAKRDALDDCHRVFPEFENWVDHHVELIEAMEEQVQVASLFLSEAKRLTRQAQELDMGY